MSSLNCLPRTRQELRDWCLTKLGHPVLDINLSDEQIEDRISEAIAFFQEYHFDGVERLFLKHQITASSISFDVAASGKFIQGETVTGSTSGAKARFFDQADDDLSIRVSDIQGTFQDGEILTGDKSGVTATLKSSNAVTIGDIDNQYITVGDEILSVINVLPLSGNNAGLGRISNFDVDKLGNGPNSVTVFNSIFRGLPSLGTGSLIDYDMFKRHLSLIQFEFEGIVPVRFNRKTNKIQLDLEWDENLIDTFLIFEVLSTLDPTQYPKIYSDWFLREYTTALLKKQWAWNLLKFAGKQLPGGVTINANDMLNEAKEELEKLEEKIQKEFQVPPMFEVG